MMRNILFTISIMLYASVSFAGGELFEDTKEFKKVVKSTDDFELEISNKHGNVVFEIWEKDSVSVEVIITAESQKLDRVNSILENINVRFSSNGDYLSASTEWSSATRSVKNDVLGLFGEQSVHVNYLIKMPAHIEVEVDNKFGNVTMGNVSGKLKIDVSHGNINLRKVKNAKTIKLQYGNFRAKELGDCDLDVKFSDIAIDKAGDLKLTSTSSEIEIEKVDKLVLKSVSDDIEIEEINELNFSATFSNIEIEKLNKSAGGTMKYGSIEIEEIRAGFRDITIDGQVTDIDLNFEEGVSFNYFVQLEKGKSFIIPSSVNTLDKDNTFDEIHQFEGSYAKGENSEASSVRVISKNSYIQFGKAD
ncbi:MAG: hypothetical protein ACI9N1_002101 [Flavobacteriales bacterium]|jgi:hypothetical protein